MNTPHARYQSKMALMAVTQKMTAAGWRVDREFLAAARETAATRVRKYACKFGAMVAELSAYNPSSILGPAGTGQTTFVRDFFFNELAAPVIARDKKTKRPQLNSATLVEWASKDVGAQYAAPAACLYAIRKNRKLIDYCTTYLAISEADGRVHFRFNPCGTQTGRWTSSASFRLADETGARITYRANAQQIPKKELTFDFGDGSGAAPLVSSLRPAFLADEGCVLLRADYDQLELRLIAYVYGVKALLDALAAGTDIHLLTASKLFAELGVTPDSDKSDALVKKARDAAKPMAYALSYQMSTPGRDGRYVQLFKTLKEIFPALTEDKLSLLVKRFFSLYPEIQTGQQLTRKQVEKHGYAELTLDGRRLHYPATVRGFNQALNFPMQGTGAALIDRAVLEIDAELSWQHGEQIRAQVHDELVVQAPVSRAAKVASLIEIAMSRPAQIGATYAGIPAAADPGFNWGACMSWDKFDWAAV